jgi:integrase
MRGSIRRRGNTWQVRVNAGTDPVTKKRVVVTRTCRDEKEAEVELTTLLRQLDTGSLADPGRITLATYLVDTWLPHQTSRVRARTLNRYRTLLLRHVIPSIGGIRLAKLRSVHIQGMLDSLKLSAQTRVHVFRVLNTALRYAVKQHLINSNPADGAEPPRAKRPALTVPLATDVKKLMGSSEGWLHNGIVLAASTGMRRGEVLALQWQAVDLIKATASVSLTMENIGPEVRFAHPKTDRSRRSVSLPPSTVTFIKRLRTEQHERRLLLGEAWQPTDLIVERGDGGPIHPDLFSTRFARLATKVGLGGVRLHDLRHFYASELLRAGGRPKVVSEGLGHSSTAFTMDTYSHLLPTMQETAAAAIEAALG